MRKHTSTGRILVIIISLTMALTVMPAGASATEQTSDGPRSVSEEGVTEKDAIDEGTDESMTTFDLGEGKRMTVLYSGQVRYEDENGDLRDCDPSLTEVYSKKSLTGKSLSGYSFETASGESKAYLPEGFTKDTPLLLEKGDYSISFAPSEEISFSGPSVSKEEFLNGYEEKEMAETLATYETEDVSLQYESQTDGIKEKIIFKRRPEEDHFDFDISMEGLRPEMDEEGGIRTLDQKSKRRPASWRLRS